MKYCIALFILLLSINIFSVEAYLIYNWEDLAKVGTETDMSGFYVLMNDLEAGTDGYSEYASETANSGEGWIPLGTETEPFTGVFNGNKCRIVDLFSINSSLAGLFGCVQKDSKIYAFNVARATVDGVTAGVVTAVIKGDALIEYVTVDTCEVTGAITGGIAGYMYAGTNDPAISRSYVQRSQIQGAVSGGILGKMDGGLVEICAVTGNGTLSGSGYLGGIVGYASIANIKSCYNEVDVVADNNYAGGVCGYIDKGIIAMCYSIGDVSGDEFIGGFVGKNYDGAIYNSWSAGDVTGNCATDSVGGFMGRNYKTISQCYYYSGATIVNNGSGSVNTDGIEQNDNERFYLDYETVYTTGTYTWDTPPWYWHNAYYPDFANAGWEGEIYGHEAPQSIYDLDWDGIKSVYGEDW